MKGFSLNFLTRKSILPIFVFLVIFIALFYRLGSYPSFFAPIVEHTIHPAVTRVLDNKDISSEVTWQWTDMHSHGSYKSPLYTSTIILGLRLFGFNLLGVRFVGALITFFSLIVFYYTLKKLFSKRFALIFIILLASSPWFLVFQRSGGILNISLSLVLLTLSAALILLKNKVKLSLFAFLCGLGIALFPYGYVTIRVVALLLIFWVILVNFLKKSHLKMAHVLWFLLPISFSIFLQKIFYQTDIASFFHARGESVAARLTEDRSWMVKKEVLNKVVQNVAQQVKVFSGDYLTNVSGKLTLIQNHWHQDELVYPKLLVPFFLLGLVFLIYNVIKKRSQNELLFLSLLPVTLIPGTLAWMGAPNPTRNYIAIIPLYFCITYAIDHLYFHNRKVKKNKDTKKSLLAIVGMILIIGTTIYQLHNYFYYQRDFEFDRKQETEDALHYVLSYTDEYDNSRVIIHESNVFNIHSNTLIRYFGKNKFQRLVRDGRVLFVNDANRNLVLGNFNKYDIFVTSSAGRGVSDIVELQNFGWMQNGRATIYFLR